MTIEVVPPQPEIVIAPEAEVPPALRAQVLRLHAQAWPPDGVELTATDHDPALRPLSMLLVIDGRLVAALDILFKTLVHRGVTYAAGGLSTVVTDVGARRTGHGLRLVRAARERMEAEGADLAIFTCDPPLVGFYQRAGFEVLAGSQVIGGTPDEPLPSGSLGKVTLGAFFTPSALAHRSGFVASDIELYPGPIDRLW